MTNSILRRPNVNNQPKTILCVTCGDSLTGGIDTYGDPFREMCLTCWFNFTDPDPLLEIEDDNPLKGAIIIRRNGEVINADDDDYEFELDDEIEFIERDGMTFCGACGILACPGEEEFDWCDHVTGSDCSHFASGPFAENDDFDGDDE